MIEVEGQAEVENMRRSPHEVVEGHDTAMSDVNFIQWRVDGVGNWPSLDSLDRTGYKPCDAYRPTPRLVHSIIP